MNDLVTGQDAFVFHVCPIRILKRMLSNTTITRDHEKSVFLVVVRPVTCQVFPRIQITLPYKWQLRTAHQSNKNFGCGDFTIEFENDYIFEFATEVNEETTNENDDVPEENYMMIYVKMINGKTISIKCEGKPTAALISDEVERRSLIPRDMTYLAHKGKVMIEKKTIEENNIEAEATLEMSPRHCWEEWKRMNKWTHMKQKKTEEKKRKLEEGREGKMTKPNDDTVYLRRDIMEALERSEEKMVSYSRKADEKMESYSRKADEMMEKFLQITSKGMNSSIVKMKEEGDDRYKQFNERITNIERKILDMDEKHENRSEVNKGEHVDENQGKAVVTGFHSETTESEVTQLLKESINEVGMDIGNARIECTAKPITLAFIHFKNDGDRNKFIRSANMLKK